MRIDLRSDTVTKPTEAMRKAMYEAEVGDINMFEDPTVLKLEEMAAERLGKEAAILVTSGTQGNQVAILSQTGRGDEIIVEASSHIVMLEGAAHAVLAGVQPRQVPGKRGVMNPDDVRAAIRPMIDPHYPKSAMICVENTHNFHGGVIVPNDNLAQLQEIAQEAGIRMHMDGARVFNAAVASGLPVSEITKYVDTVQVCFTKGLGAPVGSILAGDQETINTARHWRKRLGGTMRQAGVVAAPMLISLTEMVDRLAEDHANARLLAEGLANIEGVEINLDDIDTNMIYFSMKEDGPITARDLLIGCYHEGVMGGMMTPGQIRFVTHHEVTTDDIHKALEVINRVAKSKVTA
ncbi:threonine aldolase [Tumebacillus algifaecis]|uniref:Threonine aldolase n=1 Tax=Tumebacillus algifaecis TaxID=1214604 RepID=A0A223CZY8_9BACL|nr:GntG family PLP-dependent aldolase [Tumebacillus algifaecis]ASS74723.1 threonine aldolase [Tumebacillus algifaecis]